MKHVPDLLKDVPLNRLFLGCDMDFDMPEKKLGKKLLKTVREKAAHLFPGRPKELKIEDIRELQKIVSLTNDDKKFSYLTVETNVPNLELLHELFSRYKEDKYSLYKYIVTIHHN